MVPPQSVGTGWTWPNGFSTATNSVTSITTAWSFPAWNPVTVNHPYMTPFTIMPAPAAVPAPAPAPRAFNRYVNGSDLLEEFIAYLGTEGVRKREIMGLPVELFVKWLIIRACEQEQEEPGVVLTLPAPKPQPRCLGCQRWMPRAAVLPLHGERCASRYFGRRAA